MLIMRVSAIQMDMKFADPAYNFKHAEELIREAAASRPDVIVLPETWNTGFFPKENLKELSDKDGAAVKDMCSALASWPVPFPTLRTTRFTTPPTSLTVRACASPNTTKPISSPRWASMTITRPAPM